jgi:hypothetical protein
MSSIASSKLCLDLGMEPVMQLQARDRSRVALESDAMGAAGLGIRLNQFTIDYAITPFGELGNSHSITLSSWFGGQKPVLNNPELSDPTPTVSKEEKTVEPVQDNRDILILPNEDDPLNRQLQ